MQGPCISDVGWRLWGFESGGIELRLAVFLGMCALVALGKMRLKLDHCLRFIKGFVASNCEEGYRVTAASAFVIIQTRFTSLY